MTKTWDYLSPSYSIPPAPIIVNEVCFLGAGYYPEGFVVGAPNQCWQIDSDPTPAPGRIYMQWETGQHSDLAFSTVITHEYGHFWLYMVPEIEIDDAPVQGFHEGFADTLSHMVHNTHLIGEKAFPNPATCGKAIRDPNNEDVQYPSCIDPNTMNPPSSWYRGMLLSKIWLNMLTEFEATYGNPETAYTKAKAIHLGWMLLVQPPGPHPTSCTTLDQSASEETLIEVLVIDSPTDDPANAVHLTEICEAFNDQNIDDPVCPDSAGTPRRGVFRADCDGDARLDVFDYMCFRDAFLSGRPYADCDRDGRLTSMDFVCFQEAFLAPSH